MDDEALREGAAVGANNARNARGLLQDTVQGLGGAAAAALELHGGATGAHREPRANKAPQGANAAGHKALARSRGVRDRHEDGGDAAGEGAEEEGGP